MLGFACGCGFVLGLFVFWLGLSRVGCVLVVWVCFLSRVCVSFWTGFGLVYCQIGLGLDCFCLVCALTARFLGFFGHDLPLLGEGQGRGKAGKPFQPSRL
jgi:hypothetical protein